MAVAVQQQIILQAVHEFGHQSSLPASMGLESALSQLGVAFARLDDMQ